MKLIKKLCLSTAGIFFLITVLSYPAFKALTKPGLMTGHDTQGHFIRLVEFDRAIKDGHFPVRWSKRLNWGLGYPYFNFAYPLPYYIEEIFLLVGLDYLTSFKLIFILSFPLGWFFMLVWLRKHFSLMSSFIAGAFYTYVPYHFLNVYVRGAIGEVVAMTLLPLAFYSLERLLEKVTAIRIVLLGLSIGAIVTSHNISAMIFMPLLFIYGYSWLYKQKRLKELKFLGLSFGYAAGITAFFWIPAITEEHLTKVGEVIYPYFLKHYPTLQSLLYSPWGFGGSKVGIIHGEMSFQIGLLHIGIVIASLGLLFWKGKGNRNLLKFGLLLTFGALFIMQPASSFIVNIITPLKFIQFPWRLLLVETFSITILSAVVFEVIFSQKITKGKQLFIVILVLGLLLFFNRNHWRVNEYYSPPAYFFDDRAIDTTTTLAHEHAPKWQNTNVWQSNLRFQIKDGSGVVENTVWKTNYHEFVSSSNNSMLVTDRTVYYPGWEVYIDGVKTKTLDPWDPVTEGLITFEVPSGSRTVITSFRETPLRFASNLLSLAALVLSLGIFLKFRKAK